MSGRFRHDFWLVFFVIPIIIGLVAGQTLVLGFGFMGLLVGFVAWLWNRVALEEVTYERTLGQQRAFVGDEVSLAITLTNRKPVPLGWLKASASVPPELRLLDAQIGEYHGTGAQMLLHSTSMASYERIRWDYRLKCLKRGYFRLGPARLESGDLFGFYSTDRTTPGRDDLLVYPEVVPLEDLGLPALHPLGEARTGMRIYQDVSRPSTARDYQRGDPLRWVDWKLSARVGRLQVRTFEPSSSTSIVLVVAIETTPLTWGGYSEKLLERVIKTGASVAGYVIEHGYKLGLFSNGSAIRADRPMVIPPSAEPERLTLVLEALATITPIVMSPIARKLAEHARRLPQGATLVIVAALVSRELAAVILDLKDRGHPVVVVYVGDDAPPELPDGVIVHEIADYLNRMELAGDFGPG